MKTMKKLFFIPQTVDLPYLPVEADFLRLDAHVAEISLPEGRFRIQSAYDLIKLDTGPLLLVYLDYPEGDLKNKIKQFFPLSPNLRYHPSDSHVFYPPQSPQEILNIIKHIDEVQNPQIQINQIINQIAVEIMQIQDLSTSNGTELPNILNDFKSLFNSNSIESTPNTIPILPSSSLGGNELSSNAAFIGKGLEKIKMNLDQTIKKNLKSHDISIKKMFK